MRDDPSAKLLLDPKLKKRLEAISRHYRSTLSNLISSVLEEFATAEEKKLGRDLR